MRTETAVVQTFIRGVGSNLDTPNVQPAVAFTYNGIVIPRFASTGLLFDVGSVQVISGPQGTLYGGSAAGGAINIITTKPQADLSGDASLEGGNYGTFRVNVGQNAPVADIGSVRADIDYERHDGYQTGGFDALNKIEGRASALIKPVNDVTALLFFSASHESGTPTVTVDKPFLDRSNPWFVPTQGEIFGNPFRAADLNNDLETYVAGANVEWRLGDNTFTYIPGFVRAVADYNQYDADFPFAVHYHVDQHSEELRWSRTFDKLRLSAGVFYLFSRTNFFDTIAPPLLAAPPFLLTVPIDVSPATVDTTYAGYGQAVYSFTDRLRLTVGGRYTNDQVKSFGSGTVGQTFLPYTFNKSQDHPDWKVGLDFDLAPRVLLYANAQTGYIPIAFAFVPRTATNDNYVPESRLLAFSGGFKSRFLDNHLEVNDELYYYDYLNFQAVDFNTQTGITTDVPAQRSTIYGDELSIRVLLPRDFEFDTGMNFMSAHYNEFSGPAFNYSGNQLIDAPTANVVAGLQKDVRVSSFGSLRARVSTHYESGHYGVFTNAPGTRQGAYTVSDFNLTYTPDLGGWSVQAYVNNLENQPVFGSLSPGAQGGVASGFLEPPRTFGGRILAKWR